MPKVQKRIFLDYASITPIDQKVAEEMKKAQKKLWANPSSLHQEGEEAKKALEEARQRIARILHCRADEVFFTSGGTESLNIAILGAIKAKKEKWKEGKIEKLPHVITSIIEHPAVLEPIRQLVERGEAEVSYAMPNEKGIVNPESIKRELKANTVMVAIQHANNEIGTVQPVREISKILKNFRDESRIKNHELSKGNSNPKSHDSYFMIHNSFPYLLIDASQSVCYEDVSIERLGADILVLDGMKMYGPRGAGILVIKHGVKISPIVYGGGQEGGLKPGTQNVSAALGLAKALELARRGGEKEFSRLQKLRDYAINKILREIPNSSINGDSEKRLPNNLNICLPGQDSEFLVIKLDTMGFAVSAASACHTLKLENGSYVIEALGKPECASSSLRITLGRETKKSDLDKFIAALKKITK